MSKWTGTLRYLDIGPGTWVLDTDEGETLQLSGSVPRHLAGRTVEVEGRPVNAFGFGMTSDRSIEVRRVSGR